MNPKTRSCPECQHSNRPYEVEACSKCGYVFLWRRSFGRKGYNRVTVYEREAGGPLQILWWDRNGAQRESLTNLAGVPIFDREKAERIAKRVSEEQGRARSGSATLRHALGIPERHTVGELFAQIHADLEAEWSVKWARDQRRYRRFWEKVLGRDTDLTDVTPGLVSRIVAKEARSRGWAEKTQNHYLNAAVEAWGYAETYLKWIGAKHNLAAVKRHRIHVDNQEISYESAEAHRILARLPEVDLRAAVAGELSYVGGRRLTSIRTLGVDCYRSETRIVATDEGASFSAEFGVVTFPAATDKAKRAGEVYLYGKTKALIERLIATPACQASGLLFPKGDLQSRTPPTEPITAKRLRRALRRAEELAEVPSVKGRSFHGFKRTFATDAEDQRAASAQSGTTEETMRRIYRQPKPSEKAGLAIQLDSLRRGA